MTHYARDAGRTPRYRVLLFEPGYTGHRLAYVKHILDALADLPIEVTLVLDKNAPFSEEFNVQLSDVPDQVTVEPTVYLPPGKSSTAHAIAKYEVLVKAIRSHRPDHLYVPYADGLSQVMGLRRLSLFAGLPRGLFSECLMMRGSFAYEQERSFVAKFRDRLAILALIAAPWQTAFHIDPMVYGYLRRRSRSLRARLQLAPDPIEPLPELTKNEARSYLEIPREGRYVVFSGRADERKGADLLIRAFARADLQETDRLLLAGKIQPVHSQRNRRCGIGSGT